jgi:hypothetical protein
VAERGLPQALALVETAHGRDLEVTLHTALNRVNAALDREIAALQSIREIYTGSDRAQAALNSRINQWRLYREGLNTQTISYAQLRADELGVALSVQLEPSSEAERLANVVPAINPEVKRREFYLNRYDGYSRYLETHPNAIADLGLRGEQTRWILNFVNGERSLTVIRNRVAAITGDELRLEQVDAYLTMLEDVGWIVYRD